MPAVEVESLTISYGKVTAVDGLSFTAEAGEVTCLLGPNGAGKTSTVEALEGLRRPTSGRLSVVGLDPLADHVSLTPRIGVMLQEGGIHPAVRVREAMRHAAALYPDPIDVDALVDRLGLTGLERRTYRQLSGGEQRRLALALALVGRPQVAFLDEPTSGVDPVGRQVIRQVIADLRNDGVTVLLTTHDLDEAERIADRVVIILDGRLVASGTVGDLTRSSGDDEQVRFRAPAGLDRASLAEHLDGADVTEIAPGDYAVSLPPTPRTVAAITAWLAEHDLALADLRAGRQRLEDVYLRLTADGAPTRASAASDPAPDADTATDATGHDPAPSGDTDQDTDAGEATGSGEAADLTAAGSPGDDDDAEVTDTGDRPPGAAGWPWDDDDTDDTAGAGGTTADAGSPADGDTDPVQPDRPAHDDLDDGADVGDTALAPAAGSDRDESDSKGDLDDDPTHRDRPDGESRAGDSDADDSDTDDADTGVTDAGGADTGVIDTDDAVIAVDGALDNAVVAASADNPRKGNRRRLRRPGRRAGRGDRSDTPASAATAEIPETSAPSTFDEFWRSVERGGDTGDDTDWSDWNDDKGDRRGGTRR